jgi:hypothetical protein
MMGERGGVIIFVWFLNWFIQYVEELYSLLKHLRHCHCHLGPI